MPQVYTGLVNANQQAVDRTQAGFAQGEQRRYSQDMGNLMNAGDLAGAADLAAQSGNLEHVQSIQGQIAAQGAAQQAAQEAQSEAERGIMRENAQRLYTASQMQDPEERNMAVGAMVSSAVSMYPEQDPERLMSLGAQIHAMTPQDMEQFSLSMGAVAPDEDVWETRNGVYNGQPATVQVNKRTGEVRPVEGLAPVPGSAAAAQRTNYDRETVTDSTGRLFESVTDPYDPSAPPVLRALDGQGGEPVGALSLASRSSQQQTLYDREGNIIMTTGGSGGDKVQQRRVQQEADAVIFAAAEADYLITQIDSQLEALGPGSVGLTGMVRSMGTGLANSASAMREYMPSLGNAAQDVLNQDNFEEDFNYGEFFNNATGGLDFLTNTLAYALARANNPDGRISDSDFRQARDSLGMGAFGSTEQFREALVQIKGLNEFRRDQHIERLTRNGLPTGYLTSATQPAAPTVSSGGMPDMTGWTTEQEDHWLETNEVPG